MSSIFQSHKCCPQHIGKVNLRSGPISCLMYDPSHLGSNLEYAVFLLTMQTCSSRGMQAGKIMHRLDPSTACWKQSRRL